MCVGVTEGQVVVAGKDGQMSLKLLGIFAVIVGCGGVGFGMAVNYRSEENCIRQLLAVLDRIQCDLEYRLTPLPELCRICQECCSGKLRILFQELYAELDRQIAPDAACCMNAAVAKTDLPKSVRKLLLELGHTLGCFDLSGQIRGIEAVRSQALDKLQDLMKDKDVRIRSYQTLGLCAGAALAILLL